MDGKSEHERYNSERRRRRTRSLSPRVEEDRHRSRTSREMARRDDQPFGREHDRRKADHRGHHEDRDRKGRRSNSPTEEGLKREDRYRESRHRDGDGDSRRHREGRDRDRETIKKERPVEEDSKRESDYRDSRQRYRREDSRRHGDDRERDTKRIKEQSPAPRKQNGPLPSQEASFAVIQDPSKDIVGEDGKPVPEKQKPNLAPTGLLAAASNTVSQADGSAIVLKYHEPPEARKPPAKDQWKLFVFKGADIVDTIDLSLRSCWLVGREVSVVDLLAEHPSISKQHAVIQFRHIEKKNEYGDKVGRVRPYLIDLESANGTKLNKDAVPGSRYLELRDTDMVQFGDSTREYVLMLPPKE